MAHEIGKTDHMFSVKEVPWHKLGVVLEDSPKTSAEAIKAAKLNWEVVMENVLFDGLNGQQKIPNAWVTVRRDPEHGDIPLGIVGNKYSPLQNEEAFEFFDPLIRDGIAEYETAGSLRDGKRVWILAKINGDLLVGDRDPITKYVLLSNSHDGSSSVTVKVTPVRVVCNNTLSAALSSSAVRNTFSLRHTSSVKEKLEQAQHTLEAVNAAYDKLFKVWAKMTEIELPVHERIKFVKHVFPEKADAKNTKRLNTVRTEVLQLFETGAGMQELSHANGTLWGAYNAVTEYVTHSISERKNSTIDTHVENLWFGRHDETLNRAFATSIKMMQERGIDVSAL